MPTDPTTQPPGIDHRPLSLLVGLAFFMEQLDATIIAPAMPDIAHALGVDALSLNLTMTIYLLCSVAFIPTAGRLAARWGTRSVFRGAVMLFVASSLLCAVATSLPVLAFDRALQGVAAALMVPVGRMAIVRVTPRHQLVQALAWMITPAMLGPLLGPPLGGLITTALSWHWIFLINLPIGLTGWWFAGRAMPQSREAADAGFDAVAWSLLVAILAGLIAALEWLRHGAGSTVHPGWGLTLFAAIALLVAAYARRDRRATAHLLDFALLRDRSFATSFWAGGLLRVGYGALPFLLPLMLQVGLGFDALQSGLTLVASGAVAFVTKTRTTALLRRWGFQRVLLVNGVLCAAGLAVCAAFQAPWSLAAIAAAVSFAGFFRAIQFNALGAIAYADLPARQIASATALNTMGQQLSIMLGISLSAMAVDLSTRHAGRAVPAGADFVPAFLLMALVALAALPWYLRLHAAAGSELSGHRVPVST